MSNHLYQDIENELQSLAGRGLRRFLQGENKERFLNLSSNDYLGLSEDLAVKEAARNALEEEKVGGTASRLLGGSSRRHAELESHLAGFLGKEAALVYPSGYHVNTGVLPALFGLGDVVFLDRLCHASIIDGVRLSSARFVTFDHNNSQHLEDLLREKRSRFRRAVIVTEGVFSMDGDVSFLADIVSLARRWDALVYLDEAHSFGVWGVQGKGFAADRGLLNQVDIFVGTLSKALGSQGGFVASQRTLVDLLVSKSRSFIYSTALSPVCAAAADAALSLLPLLDKKRDLLHLAARDLRKKLQGGGFDTMRSASQIIPVFTGDIESTKNLSDHLFRSGFFVPSIRPPTVPKGEGRIRLSITFPVAKRGLDDLVQAFLQFHPARHRIGETIVQAS